MKFLMLAGIMTLVSTMPSLAAGDAAAGQTTFARCAICHNIGPGATNKIGPALTGVVGRKPGTFANFSYSQAMTDFGTKNAAWTPELISQFIHSPQTFIPGTKMSFPGLPDQTDIDNVVAYLQSQSPAAPAK